MKFSNNIKTRRLEKDLTQQELAEILHVSRTSVSHWETGKNYPDFGLLIRISNTLDLSLDVLIKEDYNILNHVESQGKKHKQRKTIMQILIPLTLLLIVWSAINIFNINVVDLSKKDINSISVVDNILTIDTSLNGLESIDGWMLDGDGDDIAIKIFKKISISNIFKRNKNSIVEIPIKKNFSSNNVRLINSNETIRLNE